MAEATKRIEGQAIKLEKSQIDQLDLSKVQMGRKEPTGEVSAQWGGPWNGEVRSPCSGVWWHFSGLWPGQYNLLRSPDCVWNQYIYY